MGNPFLIKKIVYLKLINLIKLYTMLKNIITYFFIAFISLQVFGQTAKERNQIVKNYDLAKLKQMKNDFFERSQREKEEAISIAKLNNWPIKITEKGIAYELMRVENDGTPIYYQTYNYYSAKTVRTDKVYNNGGLGLNLQGQNMIVGLWDGGPIRLTHQLITGRVEQRDGVSFTGANDYNRHALHVTGTMIGSGTTRYRGMAFEAHEWAHEWSNDNAEMTDEASQGLLISNHSYGMAAFSNYGIRQVDLYRFGKYDRDARDWDNIMYNAPYYLIVDAAGNDRTHAANGTNKGGYDMLTGNSMMKNGITVAAVNRVNNYSSPSSVVMSSFSNWGPTDDGRIKPDISAQGVDVSSSVSDSDSSYDTYNGTSMASPAVTGSLILLQQHYNERYGSYIWSSTLKGLALHTADEAGSNPGPDYSFGWGLLNTGKAAMAISDNGLKSIVKEITLNQGDTYTFTVDADGTVPLMASICWTDPAGHIITGTPAELLDNPTPMLINDLDIRVTKNSTTYYPWKLDVAHPANAATKGDNTVDPFEKIQVDNPSGTYTVTISHKGNLKSGKQNVSIIVTGITNPFAINTTSGEKKSVCVDSNPTASFDFIFTVNTGYSGNTNFSLSGLPASASYSFTNAALSGNGNTTLNLSNLNTLPAGIYNLDVIGQNGSTTRTKTIKLVIYHDTFTNQNLVSPIDNAVNVEKPVTLEWEPNLNAKEYLIEISYNQNFSNLLVQQNVLTTSFHPNNLSDGTQYYWRVKPINDCAEGSYSPVRKFTTMVINCNLEYTAPSISIPSTANANPITSDFNYTQSDNIDFIKVFVDITHSNISDLEIKVKSPSNTEVTVLQSGTCSGNYSNISATFMDSADDFVQCQTASPSINGNVIPYESLSNFTNENPQGTWRLSVSDPVAGNGGSINLWAIEVCTKTLGIEDQSFDLFKVWPNPTHNQINLQLSAQKDIKVTLYDLSGRTMYDKTFNNNSDTFTSNIIFGHLTKGIYLLQVESGKKHATKRIIIK